VAVGRVRSFVRRLFEGDKADFKKTCPFERMEEILIRTLANIQAIAALPASIVFAAYTIATNDNTRPDDKNVLHDNAHRKKRVNIARSSLVPETAPYAIFCLRTSRSHAATSTDTAFSCPV
jgi:predicted protein tyrosine phosphatase